MLLILLLWPFILGLRAVGRLIDLYHLIVNCKRVKSTYKALKDLRKQSDLQKAAYFIKTKTEYTPDYFNSLLDYHQLPLTTAVRGAGDCEDLASLYAYLLPNKSKRMFATLAFLKQGHVMLAVKVSPTRFVVCSNQATHLVRATTFTAAIAAGARPWFDDGYLFSIMYLPWLDLPFYITRK